MAATNVHTTVTELPESRVRVEAEVPADEVERRVAAAAKVLGRSLKVPGFRAGKVPAPVIIQRVGRDAVLDEAVRESLGRWYSAAIDSARIAPVGDPELDVSDMPAEGEPLKFSIEIGVRPQATLGEYKGLEVPRRDATPSDEVIQAEVDRLRERNAKLETVEREAATGDFVIMDFLGTLDGEPFQGGEGRDQMIELGSGRLVPGFEDQLVGAKAGEDRTVTISFPDDYAAEHLAGKEAKFAVTVKEIKEKQLPDADDEFAAEAGFDTLEELREDIRERVGEAESQRVDAEYREAVLDAAVDNATVEVPDALIDARARELWEQMAHSLSHQGIDKQTYLQIAQKEEEEIIADGRPEAERALKREAVLAAIVAQEGIAPGEDALLEAIEPSARQQGATAKKLLERLKSADRVEGLRDDLAHRQALDLIVESAKPLAVDAAALDSPPVERA